ncbi:YihY/virulence factor BrkB family protein [bacterium]|nr:YihY/virulence factor BrkB family protein [bacterium]
MHSLLEFKPTSTLKKSAANYYSAIVTAGVDLFRKRYLFLAAAVSFYTLLAVIPLLAVVASIASYIPFENINWLRLIHVAVPSLLLEDREILDFLTVNRGAYGVSGFAVAYMLSLGLFRAIDHALHSVFEFPSRKINEYIRLQFVLFPIFILGMITAYILATSLSSFLGTIITLPIFTNSVSQYVIHTIHSVTSFFGFVTMFSFLFTLYHVLAPRRKKHLDHSLVTALLGSFILTLVRQLFIIYFSFVSTAKNIYGTFSSVFGFLLWVLVAYTAILFCGRVLYIVEKRRLN